MTAHSWFKFWCLFNAAFGVGMVLAAWPPLDRPLVWLLDLVYWPLDGQPAHLGRETLLAAGIGGAVTAGWCLLMHGLASHATTAGSATIRRCMLTGLTAWLMLDSAQSLGNGAPLNVLLNIVIFAGFAIPLVMLPDRTIRVSAEADH